MNFSNLVDRSINGRQLIDLFGNLTFTDLLFSEIIQTGAPAALKRIEDVYGLSPSMDGSNISGISLIRNQLFLSAENKAIINALTIIAPHTHWKDKQPVIYTYDIEKNVYVIGPHVIDDGKKYTPVSFCFNPEYPLAYEWIDDSITINADEWNSCYNLIAKLNSELSDKTIPLGIAINFRFRKSLLDEPQPSLEEPIEEAEDKRLENFSYIVHKAGIHKETEEETTEQVSWHTVSDLSYGLSDEEKKIEQELREYLNSFDDGSLRIQQLSEITKNLSQ